MEANRAERLKADATAIWNAGVDAVRADRLVGEHLRIDGGDLIVGDRRWPLDGIRRILVVGAGKAGAGMAAGVERALGPDLARAKRLAGWVNVPADCVRPLDFITLHAARPAGVNEPTAEGVAGAEQILQLVAEADPDDLCLCLISGGGSALLPAPIDGLTLAEKQQLTRILSGLGANIQQLNTVRKPLSRIKGGGLARACRAGRLVSLVISDVLGDPLDIIASGPTVPDPGGPAAALAVLQSLDARAAGAPAAVFELLERAAATPTAVAAAGPRQVLHQIIGNNAVAVAAAAREARRRGFETQAEPAETLEGAAESLGQKLAGRALELRRAGGRRCLISGGEPTVRLAPAERRGRGGRNQQLVLAALQSLQDASPDPVQACDGLALLSGGTDGEDGPTDAAGAVVDATLCRRLADRPADLADHLERNDAYRFFQPLDGLLVTGPTHTNVCDVRVIVTDATSAER